MATGNGTRERGAALIVFGLVAVAALVAFIVYWNRAPQMGADAEVFTTVDALFTAITAKDEKRLTECEQRLKAYREANKLPTAAGDELAKIIAKARNGSWESAAERLYDFMSAQKREGVAPPPPNKHPSKRTK